jgi:hypothetical protein
MVFMAVGNAGNSVSLINLITEVKRRNQNIFIMDSALM